MSVHPTDGKAARFMTQHLASPALMQRWTRFFLTHGSPRAWGMFIEARADNVRRIGESSLRHLACVLTVAFCYFAAATDVLAAEVWVVTDRMHPFKTHLDVRIIELDAPARAEAELAAQLPSDPRQAAAIVQQRLKSGGADLHRRLAVAYQCVIEAWSLGIVKLPAIVVDRQYVVYGELDVDRAVSRINGYRSARP